MSWRKDVTRAVTQYREETGLSCRALGEQMGITGSAVSQKTCNNAWNLEDIEKLTAIGVPIPWPQPGPSRVPGHELVARLEGQAQACQMLTDTMANGPAGVFLDPSVLKVVLTEIDAVHAGIRAQLEIVKGTRR